eukprot:Lankesteria_metandrocarpae@DN5336_c1_g2_i11.p4
MVVPSPVSNKTVTDVLGQVCPYAEVDDEVCSFVAEIVNDFVENAMMGACEVANHRSANAVDICDVLVHLKRMESLHSGLVIENGNSAELGSGGSLNSVSSQAGNAASYSNR